MLFDKRALPWEAELQDENSNTGIGHLEFDKREQGLKEKTSSRSWIHRELQAQPTRLERERAQVKAKCLHEWIAAIEGNAAHSWSQHRQYHCHLQKIIWWSWFSSTDSDS